MILLNDELSSGWTETNLESVVDILDSLRIPVNNDEREQRLAKANRLYPYYGATGQVGNINDFIFDGESILLGEDAAPFLEFGKAKAYIVDGKFWANNHAHILRGKGGIDNKFLCNQLNITDYRSFVSGTTRLKLTQGSMKGIPVKIAPLNEQKRIVDKIEQLFSNIDEGESLLKKVQQQLNIYRQSVLKSAVTGELTKDWREANKYRLEPGDVLLKRILKARREQWNGRGKYKEPVAPDTSNLPELPDGWVWLTLDAVTAEIITGPFGSSLHKSDYVPNGTPVINPINIKNGKIFPDNAVAVSKETLANMGRFKVRAGDVIFGRRGEMGRCAPVTHIEDGWLCGTGSLILRPTKLINVEYLVGVLTGLEVKAYLEAHCVGTTMKNLNQQVLLSITFAVPSISEQSESVDRVNAIFSQIDALEQWCASELTRSATLRQSILKDAFSGKLVPQDPNDEPASELLQRIQAERSVDNKAPKKKPPSTTPTRRGRPRKDHNQ